MGARREAAWAPGPDRPLLGEGAVHVWRAELTAGAEEVCELLCGQERERGDRLLGEEHRARWMRSRGVLRALLGRYLGRDPRLLRFATGPHGKPVLLGAAVETESTASARASASISFNLSHSAQIALYAFTMGVPVGVDVEVERRPVDAVAVARRILGAAQAERLAGLGGEEREREFRRAWVRHEAQLKCLGVGIGAQDGAGSPRPGWVVDLDLGPAAAAALAAPVAARELRCWSWMPTREQSESMRAEAGG